MLLSPRRLQPVRRWEVWGWGPRVGRGSQAPGPHASRVCVQWPTDSVPGFICAETESGGAAPLCGEPAGELEWKTQLSVRLGAGWEVRASLPALPLGAERGALLAAALGGGGIDQGQGSHVIKGGPGIKGALLKESRMAPENPRLPRTALVSSAGLHT